MNALLSSVTKCFDEEDGSFWSIRHKRLLSFLIVLLVTLSAFKLHGYSTSMWKEVLKSNEENTVLIGSPQPIRSDDWLVLIPSILSQRSELVNFTTENRLIGSETNLLILGSNVPLKHIITVARPASWGYFLSSDFGVAWNWWWNVIALFYSSFLTCYVISKFRFLPSVLIAIAFVFSPFIQFWSYNCSALIIPFLLSVVCTIQIFQNDNLSSKLWWGLFLGISGAGFVTQIYPAYQVPLGHIFIVIFLSFLINWFKEKGELRNWKNILFPFALALVIASVLTASFLHSGLSAFLKLSETDYPGQRVSLGGEISLVRVASAFLIPYKSISGWGSFGNICEAASFLMFFPFVIFGILSKSLAEKSGDFIKSPLFFSLLGVTVLHVLWATVSFPGLLAKVTLLSYVPSNRIILSLGVLNLLWLSYSLRTDSGFVNPKFSARLFNFFVCLIVLLMWLPSVKIFGLEGRHTTETPLVALYIPLTLWFLNKAGFLLYLASFSIATTAWFNPIDKGFTEHFSRSKLAQSMLGIQRNAPGRWAVFNSLELGNLPRILGLPSLGGVHFYPQFEMWKQFDQPGNFWPSYNRFAHVVFRTGNQGSLEFENPQADVLNVKISPLHEGFRNLNVQYFLVDKAERNIWLSDYFLTLYSDGERKIFTWRR